MRFYTKQHEHYRGIVLHTNKMYLCILDRKGETVLHRNLRTSPEHFFNAIKPFRDDLVVSAECIFTWYWRADLCEDEGIPFILGHALYMRAIYGAKSKNDKIDLMKIAALLRGGLMTQAYTSPRQMRATRDLMRRRNHFMRKRAELFAHTRNTASQYNHQEPWEESPELRTGKAPSSALPCGQKSIEANLEMITTSDQVISGLEAILLKVPGATIRFHILFYNLSTVLVGSLPWVCSMKLRI